MNIWMNRHETNLRKYRKQLGISSKKLADAMGISRTRMTEIESQRATLSLHEVETLAELLNVDFDYIKKGLLILEDRQWLHHKKLRETRGVI